MSIYGWLQRNGPSGFGYNSTAEDVSQGLDLTGRRYLVTGSNSGLGLETARVLAMRGATVLCAARTLQKAEATAAQLSGDAAIPVACELGDPDSVRQCVSAVQGQGQPLDGIIANAGIMALPKRELLHGQERQFFVNHIGHFILVTGLLKTLSEDGRVIILSSSAHEMAPKPGIAFDDLTAEQWYRPWAAYGQSKLANLLFARELDRRLKDSRQIACAVHPGVIHTNLGRHMGSLVSAMSAVLSPMVLKSIPQGAATQVWAAVHANPETIRGQYLADCNVKKSSRHGRDAAMAQQLWQKTEELIAAL